jgi:alanyl-tRNA synthetase
LPDELRKAHTGEHILFQSLSRVFDGIEIEKINITEEKKSLFVNYPDNLDKKKILEAELLVNKIIQDGREVKKFAGSKEEIEKRFENKVRGKWDRISDEKITVVEVDGFDYAACSGEHVENTKEIGMLLVTKVNSLGKNLHEIQFEVDEKAREKAIELANTVLVLEDILNTSKDKIESTVFNLKEEVLKLRKLLKIITRESMKDLNSEEIKGVKLYYKTFSGLDNDEIGKKVGELIKENKIVVLVVNDFFGNVSVVLARSSDVNIGVLSVLRRVCEEFKGKCGGKENFAMGGGFQADKEKIIQNIKDELISQL